MGLILKTFQSSILLLSKGTLTASPTTSIQVTLCYSIYCLHSASLELSAGSVMTIEIPCLSLINPLWSMSLEHTSSKEASIGMLEVETCKKGLAIASSCHLQGQIDFDGYYLSLKIDTSPSSLSVV
jgi:hypothetical protein